MDIPVKYTCPFGSACEEVKEGAIHRCTFYTKIAGMNPNTGEQMDENRCAISWLPLLLIENSSQQRSTGAAIESFRNEMVDSNNSMLMLAQQTRIESLPRALRDI